MAKFVVTRTSSGWQTKPCEGAKKEAYIRYDVRSVNDPSKIPAYAGQSTNWWYDDGKNHRIESDMIVRDFDDEAWFIEFNTLEDLMAFYDTHGNLVISRWYLNSELPHIEIYDDYRE